jgi:hydroxypyruvate isomerase
MTLPTRRELVATGLACSPLLSALAQAPAQPGKVVERGRIKQSVCSWCFTSRGEKWSLEKLCHTTKALGVTSVELLGIQDFPTLQKHGLTCAMASNGMGFPRGFNNPAHRDELVAKTRAAIDACAEAKFPSVIAFIGMKWSKPNDPKSAVIDRDDAFKNCVEGLKLVVGAAEKAGVTLCIEHLNSREGTDPMHGHPGYQGDDLDWVASIIRKVGSPRLKLLFDVYHVQIMHGDLIRRIGELGELIGHVHTAGNPGRGELDENQEIQYPAVMKALLRAKYTGFVGQEFIPTREPLASLIQAIKVCDV